MSDWGDATAVDWRAAVRALSWLHFAECDSQALARLSHQYGLDQTVTVYRGPDRNDGVVYLRYLLEPGGGAMLSGVLRLHQHGAIAEGVGGNNRVAKISREAGRVWVAMLLPEEVEDLTPFEQALVTGGRTLMQCLPQTAEAACLAIPSTALIQAYRVATTELWQEAKGLAQRAAAEETPLNFLRPEEVETFLRRERETGATPDTPPRSLVDAVGAYQAARAMLAGILSTETGIWTYRLAHPEHCTTKLATLPCSFPYDPGAIRLESIRCQWDGEDILQTFRTDTCEVRRIRR